MIKEMCKKGVSVKGRKKESWVRVDGRRGKQEEKSEFP